MDAAAFLVEVCRRAGEPLGVRDPLAAAYSFLDAKGSTAEGQLVRRLVYAISHDIGGFDESDVWLLSRKSQQLVSALVRARMDNQYTARQWVRLENSN